MTWIYGVGAGLFGLVLALVGWWISGLVEKRRQKIRPPLGIHPGWLRIRLDDSDRYYLVPVWMPMLVFGEWRTAGDLEVGYEVALVRQRDGASDRGFVTEIVRVDKGELNACGNFRETDRV